MDRVSDRHIGDVYRRSGDILAGLAGADAGRRAVDGAVLDDDRAAEARLLRAGIVTRSRAP